MVVPNVSDVTNVSDVSDVSLFEMQRIGWGSGCHGCARCRASLKRWFGEKRGIVTP